jgi:hypothetical protein
VRHRRSLARFVQKTAHVSKTCRLTAYQKQRQDLKVIVFAIAYLIARNQDAAATITKDFRCPVSPTVSTPVSTVCVAKDLESSKSPCCKSNFVKN